MSQHDYNLADDSGAAFRVDANLLFQAIASLNSGSSAPTTTFANMSWFDTANNLMKVRKEDDSGWITIAEKTATEWKPYWGTALADAAFQAKNAILTSISAGDLSAAAVVFKTADETVNNSTTLQDDDHLLFAMAANITYLVYVSLQLDAGSTAPDWKFGWSVPSGCTMTWQTLNLWDSTGAAKNESGTVFGDSSSFDRLYAIRAFVRNGANAGNLQFQWAQDTAHASNNVVKKHSSMIITKLGAT